MASISDYMNQVLSNPAFFAGLGMLTGSQPGGNGALAGFGAGLGAYGQALHKQQQLDLERQRAEASQQYTQALTADTRDRREGRRLKQEQEAQQARLQQEALEKLQGEFGPMATVIAQAYGIDPAISLYKGQQLDAHRGATLAERERHNRTIEARSGGGGGGGASGAGGGKRKLPTPSQIIEEPLGDGTFQKHIYDAELGGYKPYGKPFRKGRGDSMADWLDPNVVAPPAGPQPYNPQPTPGLPGANAGQMIPQRPNLQGAELLTHGQGGRPPQVDPQMAQDFAEAQRIVRQNPQLAPEINRRLQQRWGRGL